MMALDARLLPEVRGDDVDLGRLRADEAEPRGLVAVHPAEPWAKVAVAQMGVRPRPFLGRFDRGQP